MKDKDWQTGVEKVNDAKESDKYTGVWFWNKSWWFEDETQNFVGPYDNEEQANSALARYVP